MTLADERLQRDEAKRRRRQLKVADEKRLPLFYRPPTFDEEQLITQHGPGTVTGGSRVTRRVCVDDRRLARRGCRELLRRRQRDALMARAT